MERKAKRSKEMLIHKKIKAGGKYIDAISLKLLSKNLIVFRAERGYVMCGYLNLKAAERFNDTAIMVTGVSTIGQALKTVVHSCSLPARKLGVYKGQPIKEALKLIS